MKISLQTPTLDQIQNTLTRIQRERDTQNSSLTSSEGSATEGGSFMDHLREKVKEVNTMQHTSDRMGTELATGKSGNIHETMLAATQAELSFNLLVQVRNKALEAYTEIMRMPV